MSFLCICVNVAYVDECVWAHEDQRACGYLTPSFFALLLFGTVSHQQAPVILLLNAGFTGLTQSHTQ